MQWLGGIGIIVMAIIVFPLLKVGGMQLFKMESSHNAEKIFPRTAEVAKTIISTYLVLTLFCGFFYWSFGMGIFDSVAHAMTTISTGGFSPCERVASLNRRRRFDGPGRLPFTMTYWFLTSP